MIELFYGEGKGKTTCAMGIALRAQGRGRTVCVAQFLKSEDTGERFALRTLPGVTLLPAPEKLKFTFAMSKEEKQQCARDSMEMLRAAETSACDIVILDEICAAVSAGMVPLKEVLTFLDRTPEKREIVLTGRSPAPELLARADYATELKKVKHPYDRGVPARLGIEW